LSVGSGLTIAKGLNHAFETTLGGKSVTAKILQATKTHSVLIWFCRLSSPELHIARVEARIAAGAIPFQKRKSASAIRWRR
jgi:predicted ABC-type ATPase